MSLVTNIARWSLLGSCPAKDTPRRRRRRPRRTWRGWPRGRVRAGGVAASSPCRAAVAPRCLRSVDCAAYLDCDAHMASHGGHDVDCAASMAPPACNHVLFGVYACLYDGQASSKIFRNASVNHGARYCRALVRKRVLQCCERGVGFWTPPRSSQVSAVSNGVALTMQVPKTKVFCLFLTSLVRL